LLLLASQGGVQGQALAEAPQLLLLLLLFRLLSNDGLLLLLLELLLQQQLLVEVRQFGRPPPYCWSLHNSLSTGVTALLLLLLLLLGMVSVTAQSVITIRTADGWATAAITVAATAACIAAAVTAAAVVLCRLDWDVAVGHDWQGCNDFSGGPGHLGLWGRVVGRLCCSSCFAAPAMQSAAAAADDAAVS
jgi:hypothetical protein